MSDCRTCRHNLYIGQPPIKDWVDCGHPVTFAKRVNWEKGDPAMVNYRTGDVPVREIHNLQECPTYEAAATSSAPRDPKQEGICPHQGAATKERSEQ